MEHKQVNSTNIVSHAYDPATQKLEIKFRGQEHTYTFHDVPQSVYDAFNAADSFGKHFHERIKGKFKHTKGAGDKT